MAGHNRKLAVGSASQQKRNEGAVIVLVQKIGRAARSICKADQETGGAASLLGNLHRSYEFHPMAGPLSGLTQCFASRQEQIDMLHK
jgi:hypothetical protein